VEECLPHRRDDHGGEHHRQYEEYGEDALPAKIAIEHKCQGRSQEHLQKRGRKTVDDRVFKRSQEYLIRKDVSVVAKPDPSAQAGNVVIVLKRGQKYGDHRIDGEPQHHDESGEQNGPKEQCFSPRFFLSISCL
jgi:hypothetical protein